MPKHTFIKNITYLRKKNNLTQKLMDIICGHNSKIYCQIESGNIEIQLNALKRLSDYFKVSIDDLFRTDISIFSKQSLADFYLSAQLSLKSKND